MDESSHICEMYLSLRICTGSWYCGYRKLKSYGDEARDDSSIKIYYYVDADGDPNWVAYFNEDGNMDEVLDMLKVNAKSYLKALEGDLEKLSFTGEYLGRQVGSGVAENKTGGKL